jgi:hypothetical protein
MSSHSNTLLAVSCSRLKIVNYGNQGSGFLSRMYQRATGPSNKTSSDLRIVILSQGKPFSVLDESKGNYDYTQV